MKVTKYICDKRGKETESYDSNYYQLIIEKKQGRIVLDLCKDCIEILLKWIKDNE